LKFFAGFEADGFAGGDADFFAGARVAADAGFAGLDAEDAEAAEFDALAAAESLLEGFEDRFDSLLGFGAADESFGYNRVHNVQLDHTCLLLQWQMLEGAPQVVKTRRVNYTVFPFGELFWRCKIRRMIEEAWMSVKPDRWIRKMALEHKMIEPFTDRQVREGVISYGVSSYGYDIRVADEFQIFTNVNSTIVDPKHFDPRSLVPFKGDACLIPPNSFALARSVEYFRIPRNVLTICLGKSTYARCGIIVNVTPFEPEWEGFVTLEISNTTPLPAKIYANEGLCQVLFFESDEDCEVSYKDKKGKYQAQSGIVLPRL
jgi:dCTP deaminase